jgi:CelD/BcsL family acetyltransferase involved in cellulose biosynthesis
VWPVDLVEFIGRGGDVTPEYLDLIAADGYHESVAEAVGCHIASMTDVDGVDLRPLPSDSRPLEPLRRVLESAGLSVSVAADSVCPVMTLPESTAAFAATRSRNYHKKLGEFRRRCQRDIGGRIRLSATVDELRADMTSLVDLHHKRWRGQSQAFKSVEYVTFHQSVSRRFLERGWVRLFCLDTSQGPAGLLYCFAYDGRYYYYQAGRDPAHERQRVGLVLLDHAIRAAISEGAREFDFLTGQEPYKYRWANRDRRCVALVGWRTRIPVAVGGLRAALGRARQRASELWPRMLGLHQASAEDARRRIAYRRGRGDEYDTPV